MSTATVRSGRPLLAAAVVALAVSACGGSNGHEADTEATGDAVAAFDDCATAETGPASILGFDPQTGEQRYQRLAGSRTSALSVDGVLVASGGEGVAGYDPATGAALWCLPTGSTGGPYPNTDLPLVVDDLFIRTTGGRAEGIDAHTGEVRWSTPVPADQHATIAVRGGQVVVLGERVGSWPFPEDMRQAVLARLDGRTGEPVEGPADEPWLLQRDAGSSLVILESMSTFAVSGADGAERWRGSASLMTSVLLDGDLVLVSSVGDRGEQVRALSAADGTTVWEAGDVHGIRMFLAGDTVFVAGRESLVALDRATGEQRFHASYETIGRGGRFTEAGYFDDVAVSADGAGGAGLLVASEPHRD
jgi:outer membrane protein assembly factor BamB